jgi:hypothetical protein
MNPAGWPLFLPSCHSYVRTVASELAADDQYRKFPGRKKSRLGMQAGYVCCVADKSRMEPLVSAPVRRIGLSGCAHRTISIHRECVVGVDSFSSDMWGCHENS